MARQTHTAVALTGPYGSAAADLAWVAAIVADKEQVRLTGKEIILARNLDGSIHNVTITSVADPFGRSGDITEAVAATGDDGDYAVFGPFAVAGWQQEDGYLYFEADDANLEFAVIQIPSVVS